MNTTVLPQFMGLIPSSDCS